MAYNNTNSFKGIYNEIKILYYLSELTDCPIDELKQPDNWHEILSSFSSNIIENESQRAFIMAQKLIEYTKEKLNWVSVSKIFWTAKPNMIFEDKTVKRYCSYSNPADIVLLSDDDEYLGISLKSYSTKKPMNHKQTSFATVFEHVIIPDSREAAFETFQEILETKCKSEIEVAKSIIYLADLNYIHLMAVGNYNKTEYQIHEGFSDIIDVKFTAHKEKNKFSMELIHENGIQNANVYFKKTSYSTEEKPRYTIQVSYI